MRKRTEILGIAVLAAACAAIFAPKNVQAADDLDMYRMYNPNSGEHFYTSNDTEAESLLLSGWNYEGIGWIAPSKSNHPVYRLYNANAGDHHYTMSAGERNALIKTGWKDEGVGWYSDDDQTVPLYRQYNSHAKSGSHNYTVNKAENDSLVKAGWRGEGVAWYAKGTAIQFNGKRIFMNDPATDYLAERLIRSAGVTMNMSADEKVRRIYQWELANFHHYGKGQPYTTTQHYDVSKLTAQIAAYKKQTDAMVASGQAVYLSIPHDYSEIMEYFEGVCDDTNGVFSLLCRHVGVPSGLCHGYYLNRSGTKNGHTWAYCILDGKPYYYDVDIEIINRGKGQGDWYWYKKDRAEANKVHEFIYYERVDE